MRLVLFLQNGSPAFSDLFGAVRVNKFVFAFAGAVCLQSLRYDASKRDRAISGEGFGGLIAVPFSDATIA